MAIKILLDPGHGAGKTHNRGSVIGNEGDNNYRFSLVLKHELEKRGFIVGTTRQSISQNPSLQSRGQKAKGYDLFLSLHSNASGNKNVRGTEIFPDTNPVKNWHKLAVNLGSAIAKACNTNNRGVIYWGLNSGYQKTSKPPKSSNYFGVLRYNLATSYAMLVEHVYHTNYTDCKAYVEDRQKIAVAMADVIANWYGITVSGKEDLKVVDDQNIMGKNVLSADELLSYFNSLKVNPKISIPIKNLIETYLTEGNSEGVRGDIAFIQAVHETGKFQFGGDVLPEQNNFAGIGTTGGGVKGHYFNSPQEGVRGQVQHLKAYASKEPLKNKNVDPRFHLVNRGSAPTVKSLTGKWATDKNYGDKLMEYYNEALKFKSTTTDVTASEGEDTMKYDFIIALKDERDIKAALEIANRHNAIITLNGKIDYANKGKAEVIALGGPREVHSHYADYFIAGKDSTETYNLARKFSREGKATRDKFKAPKK